LARLAKEVGEALVGRGVIELEGGAALQVGARAEGARAGAGDDDGAHGRVVVRASQRIAEAGEHRTVDRVAPLLAVDGEPHHGPAHLFAQFDGGRGFGHGAGFLRVWSCCP
jgi:hypothetical protein